MLSRSWTTKVNGQQKMEMSSINNVRKEWVSNDFLELTNHDMSYNKSILVDFIVMLLILVDILNINLFSCSNLCLCFRVISLKYFDSKSSSFFIRYFISWDLKRLKLNLPMITLELSFVYWHPFSTLENLHF